MTRNLSCACLLLLTLALPLYGCDRQKDATAPSPSRPAPKELLKSPFREAMSPALFELPSGAMTIWRKHAEYRPTLVLFSSHPLLEPVAEDKKDIIRKLLLNGSDDEIIRRGQLEVADHAFYSTEAVSVALEHNYFSEIVLILPTKEKNLSLPDFQALAIDARFLTKKESAALTLENGIIRGSVHGIPLRVAHPDALPEITTPVVVHLDLSYFNNLYVNEVKTPLYDLLYQTAISLRDAAYPALAISLSFSNQEMNFSLDSRFMIRDLAEVIRHPEYLEGVTPPTWKLRSGIMYARVMFLESKAKELTAEAAGVAPPDPAALFAQAMELLHENRVQEGFAILDRAVALDKGYGLAYKELAVQGMEIGQTGKAIELLNKACALFPENPFLRIQLADMLIKSGRGREALPSLDEISRLPWAPGYAQIPEQISQMRKVAEEQPAAPLSQQPQTEKKIVPKRPKFNHMGMGIPGQ